MRSSSLAPLTDAAYVDLIRIARAPLACVFVVLGFIGAIGSQVLGGYSLVRALLSRPLTWQVWWSSSRFPLPTSDYIGLYCGLSGALILSMLVLQVRTMAMARLIVAVFSRGLHLLGVEAPALGCTRACCPSTGVFLRAHADRPTRRALLKRPDPARLAARRRRSLRDRCVSRAGTR